MTNKVNGKTGILTPVNLTPLNILVQKLDILITSRGATQKAKFYRNRPRVARPTNG